MLWSKVELLPAPKYFNVPRRTLAIKLRALDLLIKHMRKSGIGQSELMACILTLSLER